jgi:hypothetical protein
MTKWIGLAVLVVIVMFGEAATAPSLAAAQTGVAARKPQATTTDLFARRSYDRRAYANRPYYPYYYGRPFYYSPGPFFLPVPPLWGYGWQWW